MAQSTLIHYHIGWKPSGHQAGAKRGRNAGIGDQLRAKVLLRDHPDPRRLDLRASMRDPFERLWVRDFYLNTAFKVIVLIDASASMGYQGVVSRMQVVEEITAQLAISAYRSGDAFGVVAANKAILKNCYLPPRINRSAWLWARKKIAKINPEGQHAEGLLDVIPHLPQRKSLIFLISDFRWQSGLYRQMLKGLNHHDVVPILLQDPAEVSVLPKKGMAIVKDMETGQNQFIWMRPALKEKIEQARNAHLHNIQAQSRRFGVQPFVVKGQFDPAKLNQYFMERQG